MATKTVTPKPLTTAGVLRRLRPLLPKSFKKLKLNTEFGTENYNVWPGYTDGRVTVEVRSICEWTKSLGDKAKCRATVISIRTSRSYMTRPRTYNPRADGTFNYDGIGTALASCGLRCDLSDKVAKELIKTHKEIDKKQQATNKRLRAFSSKHGIPSACLGWHGAQLHDGGPSISITVNGDSVDLRLSGLDVETVEKVLLAVKS